MNAENKNTTEGQQNEGGKTYTQEDIIKKYCALPDNVKNIINGLILNGDQIAAAGNRSEAPKKEKTTYTTAELLEEIENEKRVISLKKHIQEAKAFIAKKGSTLNLHYDELQYIHIIGKNDPLSVCDWLYNLGFKKGYTTARKSPSKA